MFQQSGLYRSHALCTFPSSGRNIGRIGPGHKAGHPWPSHAKRVLPQRVLGVCAQQDDSYGLAKQSPSKPLDALSSWRSIADQPLTKEHLEALFRNEIPAIRVPAFATTQECHQIIEIIEQHAVFETYGFVDAATSIYKIGPAQCEFPDADKKEYFNLSNQANHLLSMLEQQGINPVSKLVSMLQFIHEKPVAIAQEPDFGQYHAGIVRRMTNGAMLHLDWAPLDAAKWSIEGIEGQLAWNLYLDAPQQGGNCIVYNRPWREEDEQTYKVDKSYHYHKEVVQDCQAKENQFIQGDLVLFNSRNYHEVKSSVGTRLTFSSFIGKTKEGMVLWS